MNVLNVEQSDLVSSAIQETRVEIIDFSQEDLQDLKHAVKLLESTPLLVKLSAGLGKFIDFKNGLAKFLPSSLREGIEEVLATALSKSFDTALLGVSGEQRNVTGWGWLDRGLQTQWADRVGVVISGAGGGAAGLAGTLVELPVTTTLIMRSIANQAAIQGEDISTESAKIECLKVFALGSGMEDDGASNSTYYAARFALAEGMNTIATKHLADVLPRFIQTIAARFGVPMGWKIAAGALPIVGAALGASTNLLFVEHYRSRAQGHFIVRRLERKYGNERVLKLYEANNHPIP